MNLSLKQPRFCQSHYHIGNVVTPITLLWFREPAFEANIFKRAVMDTIGGSGLVVLTVATRLACPDRASMAAGVKSISLLPSGSTLVFIDVLTTPIHISLLREMSLFLLPEGGRNYRTTR